MYGLQTWQLRPALTAPLPSHLMSPGCFFPFTLFCMNPLAPAHKALDPVPCAGLACKDYLWWAKEGTSGNTLVSLTATLPYFHLELSSLFRLFTLFLLAGQTLRMRAPCTDRLWHWEYSRGVYQPGQVCLEAGPT